MSHLLRKSIFSSLTVVMLLVPHMAFALSYTEFSGSDSNSLDFFGQVVATDGRYLVVGAQNDSDTAAYAGAAYVYEYDTVSQSWTEMQKLTASDAAAGDMFGSDVAVFGNTIAVSAFDDDDMGSESGSVYIFQYNWRTGTWRQVQKITASDGAADDLFGLSLAMTGSTLLIGSTYDDDMGSSSGSVYVFFRKSGSSSYYEAQKLTASDGTADDQFGVSVDINGRYLVIGAHHDSDTATNMGAAYIFYKNRANVWTQMQKITASDGIEYDFFGKSVAIDDTTVVIGTREEDYYSHTGGSAYVFEINTTLRIVNEIQKLESASTTEDYFGYNVDVLGDVIAIAAPHTNTGDGAAYLYTYDSSSATWSLSETISASVVGSNEYMGEGMALSSEQLILSIPYDGTLGICAGAVQSYTY